MHRHAPEKARDEADEESGIVEYEEHPDCHKGTGQLFGALLLLCDFDL
jgi:hypothetical protein